MLTVENIDMTLLNQGISGLIRKCGIDSKVVVEKETGELIKTLVRISPPKRPEVSRARIANSVNMTFDLLEERLDPKSNKVLSKKYPGTVWYAMTDRYLFGMAPYADKRKASVDELRSIFLRTKIRGGKARQIYPFIGRNSRQKVAITQRVRTTRGKRNKLIAHLQKNVGRLKAGWLVASAAGRIRFTSANAAPQWVTRHVPGAHGRFVDELDAPERPAFTIANFAKGITSRAASGIAQTAVNIRGKAIAQNARMFLSGKKNVGDYAKWATSN